MRPGPLVLLCMLAAVPAVGFASGALPVPVAHVRPLPFFYDLYTFRGEGSRTTVVAAFAVEAGELETESAGAGERYRFSVTLVLADTALRSVTNRHDTVYASLPHRLPREHLLYTHLEVRARPSSDIQQRVTMIDATTPGIGQLYWEYFTIPDYSGTELMLSDVALGQPGARAGWTRGPATLALLPTSQFPSSAFDVYYEIYNLPEGHPYTTEIGIERVAGSSEETAEDRRPIRLRFDGRSAAASDGTVPELRHVETSLSKGRYRLTVTVTDLNTGRTARRSRDFEVRGWERGATMVPAVPLVRGER